MTTKPKGVMIVGQKMPRTCLDCPCSMATIFYQKDKICTDFFCQNNFRKAMKTKRPSWCPLKEVQ